MTITEFLLARIAEDEAEAQRWAPDTSKWPDSDGEWSVRKTTARWQVNGGTSGHIASGSEAAVRFIASHDPARVLLDCEAKRRIMSFMDEVRLYGAPSVALDILRALALPYADHPDYGLAEWRFDTA